MTTHVFPLGPFKRPPREKQLEALRRSVDAPHFALFMEQRTGKSQVVLDTAAYHYRNKSIEILLIVAPNGVHRAWITDEIPAALPDDVNAKCLLWRSNKAGTVAFKKSVEEWFAHRGSGLMVLAVNVDALLMKGCQELLARVLLKHRVMAVIDESMDIATHGAKRSKIAHRIGRRAVVRRILDGTPVASGPLGLYSQLEFLMPAPLGFTSFYSFKARYAKIEKKPITVTRTRSNGSTYTVDTFYDDVVGYQNLEELQARLDAFSYRVTRAECADLPPKIYQRIYFDLGAAQRKVYNDLRSEFVAELASGATVTAPIVLTRYLRLQQITSNHLMVENPATICPTCAGADEDCPTCQGFGFLAPTVPGRVENVVPRDQDPRLRAFADAAKRLSGQGIVWARFTPDVDLLLDWARSEGLRAARYDGTATDDERAAAIADFQGGRLDLFVGNSRAGGRGLNLSAASWMAYYSHDWGLRARLQSEDRPQSLGRTDSVLYLDVTCEDSIDEKIVKALREGKSLSDLILRDPGGDWL